MFKGLQCVFYKMWSCSSVAFFLHLFRGSMTNSARFLFLTCVMILCRWILWLLVAPFIKQRIFLQSYVKYIEHSRWSKYILSDGCYYSLLAIAIKKTLHPFSLTESLYEHCFSSGITITLLTVVWLQPYFIGVTPGFSQTLGTKSTRLNHPVKCFYPVYLRYRNDASSRSI